MSHHHALITGLPGVGKTTLVKRLTDRLIKDGSAVKGIYTEECRSTNGERVGFEVISIPDGKRGMLSSVNPPSGQYCRNFICKQIADLFYLLIFRFRESILL